MCNARQLFPTFESPHDLAATVSLLLKQRRLAVALQALGLQLQRCQEASARSRLFWRIASNMSARDDKMAVQTTIKKIRDCPQLALWIWKLMDKNQLVPAHLQKGSPPLARSAREDALGKSMNKMSLLPGPLVKKILLESCGVVELPPRCKTVTMRQILFFLTNYDMRSAVPSRNIPELCRPHLFEAA